MSQIRLIHWNAKESKEKASRLAALGYQVNHQIPDPAEMKKLKERPPAAIVIDLTRLPAQGRDFGVWLRKQKSTRYVPLVFVGGEPEKVHRVKQLLRDAEYATWDDVDSALKQALAKQPSDVVVPSSIFEAYKDKPLKEKLGIKAGSVVALIDAPEEFERTLGDLPEGAILYRTSRACDLAVWFVQSKEELEKRVTEMAPLADKHGLWIAWPKRSSGIRSDLTQVVVRRVAESAGLVDYKISAIDKTWSGLRFTFKKSKK